MVRDLLALDPVAGLYQPWLPHSTALLLGIAVVVLILVAGAFVVWRRRRHAALDEYES